MQYDEPGSHAANEPAIPAQTAAREEQVNERRLRRMLGYSFTFQANVP
jgi:hypothetical protein